jgi:hypothetical protein
VYVAVNAPRIARPSDLVAAGAVFPDEAVFLTSFDVKV